MINENAKITLIIEGHTDNTGSAAYNKGLSMRRAEAVKKFLRAKGVPAKKLKTVAYGFSKPAQSNDTPEGRASNRRAQLEVKE
jgi:OOP family OmpA-OmpF porin